MTDNLESSTSRAAPPGLATTASAGDAASSVSDAHRQIQELTKALAARDHFIALVGHELRNSVAPMVLLAEQFQTVAEDPRASPFVTSRMALLTRNLHKFVATIDRVAEVADLRRGKLRLDPMTVDLVAVTRDACRDLEREATAGGAELVLDAPDSLIGRWDRVRLRQIVTNLVSNAIKYGEGGRVEISLRDRDGVAELVVQDHGPGLDPAMLARLFEPFDHDHDRIGRGSGFGIGLWLVKTLCTAMQGSVTADRTTTSGARFCVVLPRG
jgi:two-component system OmpR family sensor kinase